MTTRDQNWSIHSFTENMSYESSHVKYELKIIILRTTKDVKTRISFKVPS